MQKPKIYTGIGARKTPEPILKNMESAARYLAGEGFILRSGAADGADKAFEAGCDSVQGKKEIYLPWENFNGHKSNFWKPGPIAHDVAAKYHPAWDTLSDGAKKMMARNVNQMFGNHLSVNTQLVVCWTEKGEITGGTGQALRIAQDFKITVLNFGSLSLEEMEEKLVKFVKEANHA